MERYRFYILSLLSILAVLTAAGLAYTGRYLPGAAVAAVLIPLKWFRQEQASSKGRTRNVKSTMEFIYSATEVALILAIGLQPVVTQRLGLPLLAVYGLVEIFRKSLESRLQESFYPVMSIEWRLGLLSILIGAAAFNSYALYWGSMVLIGYYLLELAHLARNSFSLPTS